MRVGQLCEFPSLPVATALALVSCTGVLRPGMAESPPREAAATCDPGPALIKRLTNEEYVHSVADLVGLDVSPLVANFPPDPRGHGFNNDAASQTISTRHAYQYALAARDVAERAFANPAARLRVVGCDLAAGAPCLRRFVETFGRNVYRWPLTPAEIQRTLALVAGEADPLRAGRVVLAALLQSPKFLFRAESGVPDPRHWQWQRLGGYEIATRLAYFMTGTTPTPALLDAAGAGALDTAEGVEAAARGLLADARVRTTMRAFAHQWLGLEDLPSISRNTKTYPAFTWTLWRSMEQEVDRLLDDFIWKPGASFLDFYTGRHGYVDAALANVYQVAPPPSGFARVDFGDSADRGGFFTTAAFLAATSRSDNTSVILRGKFIREAVLCDPLPPQPPNVPVLKTEAGEDAAAAEERHTSDVGCVKCHRRIDPIGRGIERYDAIGGLRTRYSSGRAVEGNGHIEGLASSDFSGGVELGRLVRNSALGQRCLLIQLLRYGLGREKEESDECTLADLRAHARSSRFNFPELLVAFVMTDAFRYRRAP